MNRRMFIEAASRTCGVSLLGVGFSIPGMGWGGSQMIEGSWVINTGSDLDDSLIAYADREGLPCNLNDISFSFAYKLLKVHGDGRKDPLNASLAICKLLGEIIEKDDYSTCRLRDGIIELPSKIKFELNRRSISRVLTVASGSYLICFSDEFFDGLDHYLMHSDDLSKDTRRRFIIDLDSPDVVDGRFEVFYPDIHPVFGSSNALCLVAGNAHVFFVKKAS